MAKYKEKLIGKKSFVAFTTIITLVAGFAIIGGILAAVKMTHWSKYIICVLCIGVGLFAAVMAVYCIAISFSMTGKNKSVRDVNEMKGIVDTRLCDRCGRVVSETAEVCEHCGAKQQSGGIKKQCPACETQNAGTAKFCEKCGYEFKE